MSRGALSECHLNGRCEGSPSEEIDVEELPAWLHGSNYSRATNITEYHPCLFGSFGGHIYRCEVGCGSFLDAKELQQKHCRNINQRAVKKQLHLLPSSLDLAIIDHHAAVAYVYIIVKHT